MIRVARCQEKLLADILWQGSNVGERTHRATQARDVSQGASGEPRVRRSYELLEAAMHSAEDEFIDDISDLLFDGRHWCTIVSDRDKTMENRAFAFKLVSGSLCGTEKTLGMRHKTAPVATFKAMWSEQCARMVAQKKRCLHCPWSLDFVNTYGDDPLGLWCDAAQATLRFQCRLSKRHMAKIECWHAALRRRLMMRGVQAQGLIFSELVAEVVCDRARSRRSDNVVARVLDRCDTIAVRVEEESCTAPRKRKEPGPWRAYVRTQTLGTKGPPPLHALSLSYKQLDTHERDKLTAIATAAAEVQAPLQRGEGTFGVKSRALERRLKQERMQAKTERAKRDAPLCGFAQVASRRASAFEAVRCVLATPGARSLAQLVADARQELVCRARAAREVKRLGDRALETWAS